MSYKYEDYRQHIFTEEGQVAFLAVRDRAQRLLHEAGAASMAALIAETMGLNWQAMAYVDRLVELGEIREVTVRQNVAGQDRIFVESRRTA